MNNDTTTVTTEGATSPIAAISGMNVSRRRFLMGAGAVGIGVVAAACGSNDEADVESGSGSGSAEKGATTTEAEKAGASADVEVAKVAAGLEVLAVSTYKAAGEAAGANKLGPVPPAVGEFVKTAMGHHQEHLDAWNKVITGSGGAAVTEPNAKLKPVVDAEFAKVKDVAGAAKLALMLEQIAAQTYLKVLPTLKGKDAIKLAGSIQAVDQQHQAILLFALGMYPVPDTFQKTDKAAV